MYRAVIEQGGLACTLTGMYKPQCDYNLPHFQPAFGTATHGKK